MVLPLRSGSDRRPRAGGGVGRRVGQPRALARAALSCRGAVGRRLRRDLRDLRPRLRSPRGHPLAARQDRLVLLPLVAALSHLAAVALLLTVGPLLGLGWSYIAGCLLVGALLAWSHVDIARRGLARVGMRFMTVNGVVSLVYGVVAIVAVLLK